MGNRSAPTRRVKNPPVEITIEDLGFEREYKKSSARMLQIVQAAAELFHKKGYGPTTTREIGEACGISPGHLYYYIKSKDVIPGIFRKIHNDEMSAWEDGIRKEIGRMPPDKLLEKALRDYSNVVHLRKRLIAFWYHAQTQIKEEDRRATHEAERKADDLFVEIIELGNKEGVFHVKDPFLVAINIFMLAQTWALKRWLIRDSRSVEQYIDTIVDLALAMAKGSPDDGHLKTAQRATRTPHKHRVS